MSDVRKLPDQDIDAFVRIVADAYPGIDLPTEESRRTFAQRLANQPDRPTQTYGLYRGGQLLGGMLLYDFTMNLRGVQALVGGVGLVAVDILHKKKKVARDLISAFLGHYRERGACMAALYPFRPDFYRQMGFGYGAEMHQYRAKPASLPRQGARERVRLASREDTPLVLDCYTRYFQRTHGMIARRAADIERLFESLATRVVVYSEGGRVLGYAAFQFNKGATFLSNAIEVRELVYETRAALAGLLAFLHSQLDQASEVIFNTQDDHFHYLLADPRNGVEHILPHVYHESRVSGIGLMYRVLDTQRLFALLREHSFGGQSCRLKISVRDSFLPANEGALVLHFAEGRPQPADAGDYEVEIQLGVAELSSLVMGVLPFRRLHEYGLAEISDPRHLATVERLFLTDTRPVCMTRF